MASPSAKQSWVVDSNLSTRTETPSLLSYYSPRILLLSLLMGIPSHIPEHAACYSFPWKGFQRLHQAMDTIEAETECSSLGCVGKRLGPRIFRRRLESMKVPDEIYRVLEEGETPEIESDAPKSLVEFITEMKSNKSDAKTFALRLKAMLFPSLKKVVFLLDDDIVVQTDLSRLWDIDLQGKVNGAVETCRGEDKFVMSKRLKSYLNFSHPLISEAFDPNECAWAYGMNIFDLDAWKKTNISLTYHSWLLKNLKSDLSLWQLGTLPPGLIAFHGYVHVIDPNWHMLGLGYQENTTVMDAEKAAVIHFNGRAKPWLDFAFPQLRPLWTKYVDLSDKFIRACNIRS